MTPTWTDENITEARYVEIVRQEGRADKKGDQLGGINGVLIAFLVFTVNRTQSPWVNLVLMITLILWSVSLIILLWYVIRPRLNGTTYNLAPTAATLMNFHTLKTEQLHTITTARFNAIRLAIILLVLGLLPLLVAVNILIVVR